MPERQYGIPAGYVDGVPLERIVSHRAAPNEPTQDHSWPASPSHVPSGNTPFSHQHSQSASNGSSGSVGSTRNAWQPFENQADDIQRPYRDSDDSYNPRAQALSQATDSYNIQAAAIPKGQKTPYQVQSLHQHGRSQSSIAPLIRSHSGESPLASRVYSSAESPSLYQHSQQSLPHSSIGIADFDGGMPRASSYYHGDGYDNIDPWDIADDGDDGLEDRPPQRRSKFGPAAAAGTGTGTGTGTAAAAATGAGFFHGLTSRNVSAAYGPVANSQKAEKSEWLRKQSSGSKRLKWLVGGIIILLIVGAIVGGVLGDVLGHHSSNSASHSSSGDGSLYDLHSSQVQDVLNNPNLHKVFPGMDYTPLNAQYPDCLTVPPDQNNVTLDVAVMSQLTSGIRLYGTDCNQTEMVLEAISRLEMNDTMKVWLGVYLNSNTTTNTRQLDQMYSILSTYPTSAFAGVIVGNEVLFGGYMTATQLATQLDNVRTNLTAKSIHLPVATADLGVAWQDNPSLATSSDIVMANVHPFFAGVVAEDGTNWAWSFWQQADVPLTSASTKTIQGTSTDYPTQIISEIGWPSDGGHDCGGPANASYGCVTSDDGAVANITNVNTFMDSWVCQALANGTMYFWFEAFDEPWQAVYDTDDDHWEAHWGLMDVNRNLKDGVKVPDCGGKTVSSPYLLPSSSKKRSVSRNVILEG